MKRILFVDDESRILDGLRRMLRGFRNEWDMAFAEGGEAALAAFDRQRFDVIVTDMRMPGMDGTTLLARVQERSPETVRIILSGYAEREAAARAALVAHQFLSKPAAPDTLREAIDRACSLHDTVMSGRIRALLGSVDTLPAVPRSVARVCALLRAPEPDLDAVARLLAHDSAMTAKVLQLVNSSFFGHASGVASLSTAVRLLGATMIRNLAFTVEIFRAFDTRKCTPDFSIDALHRHSLLVASLAPVVFPDRVDPADAYLAGLLHDAGKLVLADRLSTPFGAMIRRARADGVPLHAVETAEMGVSHAEIGGYLLGLWHFPPAIVESVRFHHAPREREAPRPGLLAAVHVANALVNELQDARGCGGDPFARVDEGYVEMLGCADRLPAWRRAARELAAAPERWGAHPAPPSAPAPVAPEAPVPTPGT